ncbi:MAG: hypothetical protein WCW30_00750 [Candidatus Gracilibacteria bacterium]
MSNPEQTGKDPTLETPDLHELQGNAARLRAQILGKEIRIQLPGETLVEGICTNLTFRTECITMGAPQPSPNERVLRNFNLTPRFPQSPKEQPSPVKPTPTATSIYLHALTITLAVPVSDTSDFTLIPVALPSTILLEDEDPLSHIQILNEQPNKIPEEIEGKVRASRRIYASYVSPPPPAEA